MMQALRDLQVQSGGTLATLDGTPHADATYPVSFGNDAIALSAAQSTVALYDRSHWGRIQVSDSDRLRFLHNQTTNNIQALQPGQGCDTVFVNSTGRTLDLATAYALEDAVLLLVSPHRRQFLLNWMDQYIFFADRVVLKDVTDTTIAFTLLGPDSDRILNTLGWSNCVGQPSGSHRAMPFEDGEVRVAVGSGLAIAGYTLIADAGLGPSLWPALTTAGAIPLGEHPWEQLRIQQGRPAAATELTEDYNPLEAGLWHTISLSKGCYIGQETIARLHTYRGVKQQLWGIHLPAPVTPGSPVMSGEDKVGILTSGIPVDDGFLGLVYLRTKAISPDLKVAIEGQPGSLMALPYISHDYL